MAENKYPRLHVNLLQKTADQLNSLADATGLSRTDCVNRAIQLYYLTQQAENEGKDLAFWDPIRERYDHLKLL